MMLEPTLLETNQVYLELSPSDLARAWQQSQLFSSPTSRWNAYLNQLSAIATIPWLAAECGQQPTLLSSSSGVVSTWEIVNGTALTLGDIRIVLVPTEAIAPDEIRVPQEWIDSPQWMADFYVAVQVNPDEGWIHLVGYATHQQLKQNGQYSWRDRTYCLPEETLCSDLNVLWLSLELCPEENRRAAIAPLQSPSPVQAEQLLQRLADPNILMPRMEIPFELWGAMLARPNWQERLWKLRRDGSQPETATQSGPVQLMQWFQDVSAAGWSSLEELWGGEVRYLAASLRNGSRSGERLAQRVRVIQLEDRAAIALLVALKMDGSAVDVRVQLHPIERGSTLPEQLNMVLFDDLGNCLQSVQSHSDDDFIQLKRFKCSVGTHFRIDVNLLEEQFSEDFLV